MRHLHEDIVSINMSWEEFHKSCYDTWQQNHCYIVINCFQYPDEGKYIANFNKAYIPDKFTIGKGIINSMFRKLPLPEMHLKLPDDVPSEKS